MQPTAPFAQLKYRDVPEKPRIAHRFDDTEAIDLDLDSAVFGRMNVHVRRFGSGPPLLLVHGLMTSSYSWRYVFESLGEHYTCYAPDLPANGRTDAVLHAAYSPKNLGDWLIEVQRSLGIYGCKTIANSMGGYIAMATALRDPSAMSRLVNLHSPGLPELRLWALKLTLAIPGTKPLLRWFIRREPLKWAHGNVHYYDESLKSIEEAKEYGALLGGYDGAQGLVKYLREAMSVTDIRSFQAHLKERRRTDQPFPVPLLLVYAKTDPMVPPRIGRVLSERIPSAELVWLEKASHFAHVDAPDRFLRPALEFLARGE